MNMNQPVMPDQWPASSYVGRKPFCDVVMKGGVTSGVVYPFTICHIASKFVIRSIGGTSVGAIAAALTAAAEFRRRGNDEPGAGYQRLSGLPKFLGTPGTLRALFSADDETAPYLDAALTLVALDPNGKPLPSSKKTLRALSIMLRSSLAWLIGAAAVSIVADPLTWILVYRSRDFPTWIDGLFAFFELGVTLAVTVLVGLFRLKLWLQKCVALTGERDFGWAHGHRPSADAAETPPLVDWLHREIQTSAGTIDAIEGIQDRPLTFGDLLSRGLPGQEPIPGDTDLGVNLRMNTTCLTLNRPFTLPFDPGEKMVFYFTIDDFTQFFPDDVVAYLEKTCATHLQHRHLRVFPSEWTLPVVVAARMSMSFPVLFSAVRLYAEDSEGKPQPMWFSDGGLTTNMPIHFFDCPLPRWPTFAIDLLGSDPQKPHHKAPYQSAGDVFIESDVEPGVIETWDRLGTSMFAFAGAVIETARTWQDRLLGHTPGYSDRTVGIRLHDNEGGLNLTMPKSVIDALTTRGNAAGEAIVKRFTLPSTGWQAQRWTRFRNTMKMLSIWSEAFNFAYRWTDAATPSDYHATSAKMLEPVKHSNASPWPSEGAAAEATTQSESTAKLRRSLWADLFENGAAEPTPHLVSRPKF
jgi:Patatin-like phospholipase